MPLGVISEYYLPLGVINEYSGPGSIQMENTYIPCLLDGWGTVSTNGRVLHTLGAVLSCPLNLLNCTLSGPVSEVHCSSGKPKMM